MLTYVIQLNNRVEEGNRENKWIDTQPQPKAKTSRVHSHLYFFKNNIMKRENGFVNTDWKSFHLVTCAIMRIMPVAHAGL